MERIKFTFKRGGSLIAVLDEKRAPQTVKSLLEALPCEGDVMHTRWCGREIFVPTPTIHKPPKENQTNCVAKGDIAYWRDFDNPEATNHPASETLSIYYGSEFLRYHNGLLHCNVCGHIEYDQFDLMEEIGEDVWKHGINWAKVERL